MAGAETRPVIRFDLGEQRLEDPDREAVEFPRTVENEKSDPVKILFQHYHHFIALPRNRSTRISRLPNDDA